MNEAKFHHYVPRFYLSNFTNTDNKLFIYDKQTEASFAIAPKNIAGVNHFYKHEELQEQGYDPLVMEKQFAEIESEASNILRDWIRQFSISNKLIIPNVNRKIISLYITLQLLRTVEAREQIVQFSEQNIENYDARNDQAALHLSLLWNESTVNILTNQIAKCIWIFGKNNSATPFIVSDHPVLIKNFNHTEWITGPRVFDEGMYIVFPLAPDLIMYCKEPNYWKKLKKFENRITPIEYSTDMVNHENSGQIGMSYRLIMSSTNNFEFAKKFLEQQNNLKNSNRDRF